MLAHFPQQDRLLDTIYKCALELADWSEVCRDIRDIHPDMGVLFHLHEARSTANIGLIEVGFDPTAEAAYLSHYVQTNPWLAGIERQPVGAVHHTEDLCDRETLLRSEFWNDWLKPQGDFAAGSSIVLSREFERTGFIGINYTHKNDKVREDADALLRTIGPHLQRAFSLWRRAAINRERVSVYQGCLSILPMPILVVDARRRLRFANPEAESIFKRLDGLSLGTDRTLHAIDRHADQRLDKAIASMLRAPRAIAPLVAVPKRDLAGGTSGQYIIAPFPAPAEIEDLGFGSFSFYDGSLAMLAIHDTETALHLNLHTLMDTFDLTRTEAELADAVLEGLTIADYAKRKEVSRYTVRNQLSAIMRKTGTHRQAELVGLLTRLAMMH